MMKNISFIICLIAFTVGLLFSEPLINKIERLQDMKKKSIQLEQDGYYDQSIVEAQKVQDYADLIASLIESTRFWYQLDQQVKVAKQIGADKRDADNYDKAFDFYKKAQLNIGDEMPQEADFNTEEGLKYINLAIENTKKIFENEKNALAKQKNYEVEVVEIKNQFYVVRLIPKRRDSLWRIAEYEFIYNDPFKWKFIYEANRDKIKNPDLIYPGQKLVIPPLVDIE